MMQIAYILLGLSAGTISGFMGLGANLVQGVPDIILKKIFGIILLFVAVKMVVFT